MKLTSALFLAVLNAAVSIAAAPIETIELEVTRVRMGRGQSGTLHVDAKGVTFTSLDRKTGIFIPLANLREADVADPRALRFATYDVQHWKPMERRQYIFRASRDAPVEALAQFLASRVVRPVVGHYSEGSQFKVAAYHRRTFGGANGTLTIGDNSIQFLSDKPADSRTWIYKDIETIGKPDAFRFRVTTDRETYVVELKENLPETAYDLAWSKVYGLDRNSK